MKQAVRTALILSALLGIVSSAPAHAMKIELSDVIIRADEDGLIIAEESDPNNPLENFTNISGLLPGDTVTRSFVIHNELDLPYYLTVKSESPLSNPEDFIEKIETALSYEGVSVYSGSLLGGMDNEGRSMQDGIYLGEIDPKDITRLSVTFSLPGDSITNEYKGASAKITWAIYATTEKPTPPVSPSPSGVEPSGPEPSRSPSAQSPSPSASSMPSSPSPSPSYPGESPPQEVSPTIPPSAAPSVPVSDSGPGPDNGGLPVTGGPPPEAWPVLLLFGFAMAAVILSAVLVRRRRIR